MPSPTYVPVTLAHPYAETTADFTLTGTTAATLTPLAVAVAAGRRYIVEAGLIFACSNTAAAVGLSWRGPAGAAMKWNSSTGSLGYRPTMATADTYTGSAATRMALVAGRLTTGPEAGFLTLALSISDAAQTATLYADSWVKLTRV